MKKLAKKIREIVSFTVVGIFALAFVIKFGGPQLLRAYIANGIGSCQKVPLLCRVPQEEILNPKINAEFIKTLIPYKFSDMEILLPRGFKVVKQEFTKVYYKKKKEKDNNSVIYLLYEPKDFFVNLTPQIRANGINSDYEFFKRTMYARLPEIKNLLDAFFVVIKSIFIPNLRDQHSVVMAKFITADKKGFINYNLSPSGNYFDFNMVDTKGNFFKVYIKDLNTQLDLDKAFSIISTCSFSLDFSANLR